MCEISKTTLILLCEHYSGIRKDALAAWQLKGGKWTLLDSLYFSVITLTTVGYGDLAPTRAPTKIFTIVYVLLGLGILVSFLSVVAGQAVEARVERQEEKKNKKRDTTG